MNIRMAQRADLAALLRLEAACFDTDRLSRRSFLRFTRPGPVTAHPYILLVAEEHEITGYALLLYRRSQHRGNASTGRLYSLAVASAHRGQGVARRLLQAVREKAIERGLTRIRLEVDPANTPARALYGELGFIQTDFLPAYYENGRPALRMEWVLRESHLGECALTESAS